MIPTMDENNQVEFQSLRTRKYINILQNKVLNIDGKYLELKFLETFYVIG